MAILASGRSLPRHPLSPPIVAACRHGNLPIPRRGSWQCVHKDKDRSIGKGQDKDRSRGRATDRSRGRDKDKNRGRATDKNRGRDKDKGGGRGKGKDRGKDRGRDKDQAQRGSPLPGMDAEETDPTGGRTQGPIP
jgi:hypothetical protein